MRIQKLRSEDHANAVVRAIQALSYLDKAKAYNYENISDDKNIQLRNLAILLYMQLYEISSLTSLLRNYKILFPLTHFVECILTAGQRCPRKILTQ